MSKSSEVVRSIGYAFAGAIGASLGVLLVGMILFGFRFALWTEWEGGLVGVVGTTAGIIGAVIGLRMASRASRRAAQ